MYKQTNIAAVLHNVNNNYDVVLERDGEFRIVRNWRYVRAVMGSTALRQMYDGAAEELSYEEWLELEANEEELVI